MSFIRKGKDRKVIKSEDPRKDRYSEEEVRGDTITLGSGNEKILLNTYISKEDCSAPEGVDKFITNALRAVDSNLNSKAWIMSKFKKDALINEAIESSDTNVTFSDEMKPSGITNIHKKRIMGVK